MLKATGCWGLWWRGACRRACFLSLFGLCVEVLHDFPGVPPQMPPGWPLGVF
jgi:hypothetical protein